LPSATASAVFAVISASELPLMSTWHGSQSNTTVLPLTVRLCFFPSVSSASKLFQRRFCIAKRLDRESENIMNLLPLRSLIRFKAWLIARISAENIDELSGRPRHIWIHQ